jgi:aspartyl/asparaginyl-tRNA synthetase
MIRPRSATKPYLGIAAIEPVDLKDEQIRIALDRTRGALTSPRLGKILKVRTAIQQILCDELVAAGYVHPPVYMLSGCTDPLNHQTFPARLNYYGEEVSVTQSLILQKILMVMLSPVDRVFWASPNIRMELGVAAKDYKYTSEFMQVDFEKKDAGYREMMEHVSAMTARLFLRLTASCGDIIDELRGEPLPAIEGPLQVFDAAAVKATEGLSDDDAVERWASGRTDGQPFLVTNLKREAYDCWDPEQERFLNYDLVCPPAGRNVHPVECLSGAERTRSLADLRRRMLDLDYPMAYFEPFFELYESLDTTGGAIRCAGGGFGVERLTFALLGLGDIHEVYPLPRPAEGRIGI